MNPLLGEPSSWVVHEPLMDVFELCSRSTMHKKAQKDGLSGMGLGLVRIFGIMV